MKRKLAITLALALLLTLALPLGALAAETVNAPSDLKAVGTYNGSEQGIKLTWKDNSYNEEKFSIYKKEGSGSLTLIKSVAADETSYVDYEVKDGKTYTYQVVAVKVGVSGFPASNEATIVFLAAPLPLNAKADTAGITLTWTDNSSYESGFVIEKLVDSGDWTVLVKPSANEKSYVDKTADPSHNNRYRMRAYFSVSSLTVYSIYSNDVSVPATPTNLTATAGADGITLKWAHITTVTAFSIERKESGGNWEQIEYACTTTTFLDKTAVVGKTYSYRVRAYNVIYNYGYSLYSNEATTTSGTITLNKSTYTVGESITVTYSGITNKMIEDKSFIGLYKSGDPHDLTHLIAFQVPKSASGTFKYEDFYQYKALEPGNYEMRLYSTEKATLTDYLVVSASFTVSAAKTEGSMSNFKFVNTYTEGQFADVDENAWYGSYKQRVIEKAFRYGLMKGTSATTFKPAGNFTIAEAITVAARVHSIYMTGKENFVQGNPWYQVYVNYAVANGIIKTTDFTNYNAAATRAQMAYIFAHCLPDSEYPSRLHTKTPPDVNASTPYSAEIWKLYDSGIVGGSDDAGTFRPQNNITRAEAAAILTRLVDYSSRLGEKIA